jgi:hypothetical protein
MKVYEKSVHTRISGPQEKTGECAKLYNEGLRVLYNLHQTMVIEQSRCGYVIHKNAFTMQAKC